MPPIRHNSPCLPSLFPPQGVDIPNHFHDLMKAPLAAHMTAPIPPFCRMTGNSRPCTAVRGFSLVEVLVAVSVIAILIGLAIVGFRTVGTSSQQGATRALLQTCENLLSELERANNSSLPKQKVRAWAWNPAVPATPVQVVDTNPAVIDRTQTSSPDFASLSLDFWYNPQRYRSAAPVGPTDKPAPIDGPGDVRIGTSGTGETADRERHAHPVILNTAIAMAAMASTPAYNDTIAAIPADRLMAPLWRQSAGSSPGLVDYPVGARVVRSDTLNGPKFAYVASASHRATAGSTPTSTTPGSNWSIASKPTQLLLDAWGNPIIFVPASGMNVGTMHQAGKAYKAGDRVFLPATLGNPQSARTYYVAAVDTAATPPSADWRSPNLADAEPRNDFPAAVVSPVGRPFFASAGPDGDFATHDDNLYSFEN